MKILFISAVEAKLYWDYYKKEYFEDIDPSRRTVGMIGFTTERVTNIAEDAFNTGTVLFISHDRYFINNLATKIIYFDNKKLRYLVGNYDYYKNNKHKYMS